MENKNWNLIDWGKINKEVWKTQCEIFKQSTNKNWSKVQSLQTELLHSKFAKLIAIRKVTQENRGKRSSGVDNVQILTGKQRLKLLENLIIDGKCDKIRRVWIPKPGPRSQVGPNP
ncbi:reverse transcriptase N-terminal domain-containing protein [Escherichia coli]|uniref:reverse transcriptase N-terminal domain-containing protein n=1 Tax=Escherichia coli TaxID=562 RepID=UPI003B9B673E